METVEYTTTVDIPLDVMWDFIKDYENWAPMVKGYESHEKIDEKKSVWMIRGEFGAFSRLTKFNNNITEWIDKQRVAFELSGVNEPVTGYGRVDLKPVNGGNSSEISAEMGFNAGGTLGPLINRLIKPWVKTVAEDLVEKLVAAINPQEFESNHWAQSQASVESEEAIPSFPNRLLARLRDLYHQLLVKFSARHQS